jgi:hypothetical protein
MVVRLFLEGISLPKDRALRFCEMTGISSSHPWLELRAMATRSQLRKYGQMGERSYVINESSREK